MKKIEFPPERHFAFTHEDQIFEVIGVKVRPMYFEEYVEIAMEAVDREKRVEAQFRRLRIARQCVLATSNGKDLTLTEMDVGRLPIAVARTMLDALPQNDEKAGVAMEGGDGIQSPILFTLGTPIMATSKGEGVGIDELEFEAKTYGQIEDVIAETQKLRQTLELLRTVARPSGLLTMPSWAVSRVTIADGHAIMDKVLPRFFE